MAQGRNSERTPPPQDPPSVRVLEGDCLEVLKGLEAASVHAVLTDPPYGLSDPPDAAEVLRAWLAGEEFTHARPGFMGRTWDAFVPSPAVWRECFRVLKPGGFLLAYFGTRTFDMGTVAIRLAGFEIRDMTAWLYGSGFPKSLDAAKAIDQHLGVEGGFGAPKSEAHAGWVARGRMRGEEGDEGYQRPWMSDPEAVDRNARQYLPGSSEAAAWAGFGTALKPALEPMTLARKPLAERTVAANLLEHGVGALNIDAGRIAPEPGDYAHPGDLTKRPMGSHGWAGRNAEAEKVSQAPPNAAGRWPANVTHDGSAEVVESFPAETGNGFRPAPSTVDVSGAVTLAMKGERGARGHNDNGSAARFFYSAKADKEDRAGSDHPTVKPVDLIAYWAAVVCPPGGVILDPFAGTGTLGEACIRKGLSAVLIEQDAGHVADIHRRLAFARGEIGKHEIKAARAARLPTAKKVGADLPLFAAPAPAAEDDGGEFV